MRSHRFFGMFPPIMAERLASIVRTVSVRDGDVIFDENDSSDSLYLIYAGQIEIAKVGAQGEVRVIAVVPAGEFFGELGVLDGSVRNARATALGTTVLGRLDREAFLDLLHDAPVTTALEIFSRVISSLRAIDARYVEDVVRREKLTLVGEMANKVIHDFKGPFTALSLAVEMVQRLHPDAPTRRFCGVMNRNLNHMQAMMQEILDFTAGRVRMERGPVAVARIFAELVEDNEQALAARGVLLESEPTDVIIDADAGKVHRVFQNLIFNAVEAFRRGQGSRVTLKARAVGPFAEMRVEDDGPGIPDHLGSTIFDPFVTAGKAGGTGLGLSIVKNLVQAHGGTIGVDRTVKRGASFVICLPLANVQVPRAGGTVGSHDPFAVRSTSPA